MLHWNRHGQSVALGTTGGKAVMAERSRRGGATSPDWDGDRAAEPPRRWRVPIGVSAALFSVATVLATAAAIYVPWEITARQDVRDLVRQLNGEIVEGVRAELDAMFAEAEAVQDTVERLGHRGALDFEDPDAVTEALLPILASFEYYSRISYGRPNGDIYEVRRRHDGTYAKAIARWDAEAGSARRTTTQFDVADGRLVAGAIRRDGAAAYAPDQRWYRQATARAGEVVWTPVHLLSSDGEPGLRTAVVLQGADGAPHGVVSVAIELERISDYLAEREARHPGESFVFDRDGRVFAATASEMLLHEPARAGGLKVATLQSSWHPALRTAAAALRDGAVDLAALDGRRLLPAAAADQEPHFVTVEPLGFQDWLVATVVPERAFTGDIQAHRKRLAVAVAAMLVLVAGVAVWAMNRLFVRPLRQLTAQTSRLAALEFDGAEGAPSRSAEIDALSGSVRRMAGNLRAFGRYLPMQLVRTLHAQGVVPELGGERRTLSVLFMDIVGFTGHTERMGHRVVPALTAYADVVSEEIAAAGGTIDKYIGDAVMAFWGAPQRTEEHAAGACRAALQCVARLERLNAEHADEPGWPPIRVRIGINTGRVVVGNIGSSQLLDYTVIGDPVNLASRLEGLAGTYGVGVLIGQATYEQAKYDIVARRLDAVAVKGREERVSVYELLALADTDRGWPDGYAWVETYERGLYRLIDGDTHGALACFHEVIEARGSDRPSELMIARIEQARAGGEVPRLTDVREHGSSPAG